MVGLRAYIRRDLMSGPKSAGSESLSADSSYVLRLSNQFPLEQMALSITKIECWKVICGQHESYQPQPNPTNTLMGAAKKAELNWNKLISLSGNTWHLEESKIRLTAANLKKVMEDTMNHLFYARGGISIQKSSQNIEFFRFNLKVLVTPNEYEVFPVEMHRTLKSSGKPSEWKATELEPLLYLWIYSTLTSTPHGQGDKKIIWRLGAGDDPKMGDILINWWVCRERGYTKGLQDDDELLDDYLIMECFESTIPHCQQYSYLGFCKDEPYKDVISLEYGKYIFTIFFRELAKIISPLAEGKTKPQPRIRGPANGEMAPCLFIHEDISELVGLIQATNFMTLDDAYIAVILSLYAAGNLPWWDALRPKCLPEIVTLLSQQTTSMDSQEIARKQITYMCYRRASELVLLKRFESAGYIYECAFQSFQKQRWFDGITELSGQLADLAFNIATKGQPARKYESRVRGTFNLNCEYPLHDAIRSGNAQDVCHYISLYIRHTDKSSLELRDLDSMTPLTLAAWYRASDIVAILLLYGAKSPTALHYAVDKGHDEMIPILLQSGVDPDCYNRDGYTAVYTATLFQHQTTISTLLDNGANVNAKDRTRKQTALTIAVANGYEATVRLLLDRGADIEIPDATESPLLLAATCGHENIFGLLLSRGANIYAVDSSGATVLHRACTANAVSIVNQILARPEARDLRNAIDLHGHSPLERAVHDSHREIVNLLIKGAKSMEMQDMLDRALILASKRGNDDMLNILLRHGADLRSRDRSQRTALHWAVAEVKPSTVRLLLDKKVDETLTDEDGLTPEMLARVHGDAEIIKMLEDYKSEDIEGRIRAIEE